MFWMHRKSQAAKVSAQAVVIESCEPRRLLSAATGSVAPIVDGLLSVSGTRHGDNIMISIDSGDNTQLDVVINGTQITQVSAADVTRIKVNGGNGMDHITVENTLMIPAELIGGNAKDILNGGAGNDTLEGDNGNDAMSGGGGDDYLFGGRGGDALDGADGNDTLSGGKGNDNLMGDADSDTLAGGVGDDSLSGGDGNDLVEGDDGNDDVDGGTGTDEIMGNGGHDHFHTGDSGSEKTDDSTETDDDVLA
jgi:Ca2+-binding RTX toxin-like protein